MDWIFRHTQVYKLFNTTPYTVVIQRSKYHCMVVALQGALVFKCYLYLFTYTNVQSNFHIRWCSCRLTVTWQLTFLVWYRHFNKMWRG
jgi:hypothetical protein